jgi:hypothetical protein
MLILSSISRTGTRFFDGYKVVAEPLGDICVMFDDDLNERQYKLARVLYALSKGVDEIKEYVIKITLVPFLILGL